MKYPRFIREIIGTVLTFRETRKRKNEQKQYKRLVLDWLAERLVDSVIQGWYTSTKQSDPVLKTREGVKQHVYWWNPWRKYDEFFSRNPAFNTSNIQRDVCEAFAIQFPKEGSCTSYLDLNYIDVWYAVMKKMRKEIF